MTKKDAEVLRLKRFFTGEPCRNGHVSLRSAATGACCECRAGAAKRYVENNFSAVHEYRAGYRKQHADRIKSKVSYWRSANPEKVRRQDGERRAKEHSALPPWYSEIDELVVEEAADLVRLRTSLTGFKWHADHMVPLAAKMACGLHCAANIQVIPAKLNLFKSNKMIFTEPLQWLGAI